MILIITLNPLLERRFTFEQVSFGSVNRNSVTKISAGGKGINVSRQLKKLGIKSYNYFLSGGTNGKIYRDILKGEGLDFSFISTKAETRHASVIISEKDKNVSSYFSEDPKIFKSETEEFKLKLDKMIQNCEIVVFAGSSPSLETDSIIPYGIELANKYDKVSICDTYGRHLKDCIEAEPTMIHNNFLEIENSFNTDLKTENSIVDFLGYLYKKNVKRAYLTNGSKNFYASNFDYIYKIRPLDIQEIDATGSGDSFLAGIVNGWINSDLFEDSLKFATALAGLNASTFDVANVDLEDAIKIKDKIEILPVGKKQRQSMIRRTKFSLAIILFLTSFLSAQKLNSFEVNGNLNFDDSDYLSWSELRLNQPIYNGIIDSVKSKIARNLLLQGYYFFSFNKTDLMVSNDSIKYDIVIEIDEGSPVIINNIYISGIDTSADISVIKQFDYLKNQFFNKQEIEYNIQQLLTEFENSGYPFAKIQISSVSVYQDSVADENYADLYLNIISGDVNKIDKVEIRGNTSTKDYVIIRELRIDTAEPYMQNKIEEFPKRLNRLRFFEPVPIPQFYINAQKEGVLLVEVKEKNTNNFDGIIGYIPPRNNETSGYVTGLVNISLRNLFGTGRAASIKWNKYDRNSQELDLRYLEPWFLSFPLNINLGLYQRIQDTTYVQQKFGGSLEYLATEDISAAVLFATESIVPTVRSIPVFTVYNSSSITTGANLKIDTQDDPYSPTEGIIFINSYSFSRKTINGPAEYLTLNQNTFIDLQRFESSFYFFYELFTRQIIAAGLNVRELRGSTFENSDLYRLGGNNSLRGYREDQFLGSRIFWSNLEYRALLTRRSYGFLFFDTGYYLRPEETEQKIPKSEEFLYGFGLGLSLETALGVLRVSYALGEGDSFSDGKIHFGVLNEF